MDMKVIKIIGFASTGLGVVTTVVSSWVEDRKMDDTITRKVSEAISKLKEES